MHIKRFEAASLPEAIQRVKQELGPEALVLSHRSVRRDAGWFGWFGKPVVEVVAALDREPARSPTDPPSGAPDPSWRGLQLTKALVDPLEAEVRAVRRSLDALAASEPHEALRREVAGLRRALRELQQRVDRGSPDSPRDAIVERLEAAGLAPRHAHALAEEARRRSRSPIQGTDAASASDGRRELSRILAERLDARMPPPRPDEPARISLLVGATGVGKTTTLAKLAAHGSWSADEVALLTTDTYRVGADEQLRIFAERLGTRFEVATSVEDLARRVDRLGRRRVLVDTAGRSCTDRSAIPELLRCRQALGERARVELVVSATTTAASLRAELARFEPLRPDAMILTKVDEGESLAPVANLLLDDAAPPLVWLGTGQRVPQDLEIPDPEQLAVRMLGVAG